MNRITSNSTGPEIATGDPGISHQQCMDVAYSKTKLFPISLCPFEQFLRRDSRKDYPMTFVIAMEFFGQLKKNEFLTALDSALDRHRILKSVVGEGKGGRLSWIYKKDLKSNVVWCKENEPIECPEGIEFDDSKEAGVRIWVHQGEDKVKVSFYYNHVSIDGVSAHHFMCDLWAIYANLVSGPGTVKLAELDPTLLKNRAHRQRYASPNDAHPRNAWWAIKQGIKIAFMSCQSIGKPKIKSKKEIPLFGVITDTLSRAEFTSLRNKAIEFGVTANDVLTTEIFLMLSQWNKESPSFGNWRPFRVLIPTNLRSPRDASMPGTNMSSYNFLNRKTKQCRDRVELLKGIRDETAKIKNTKGTEFIEAITYATAVPWALPIVTWGRKSIASIVLSNMGDPTRRYTATFPRKKGAVIAGNLELDDFAGVPPLRDKTRATIGVTAYQRKLTISLRCDPDSFDEAHTKKMLDMIMDGLRWWTQ